MPASILITKLTSPLTRMAKSVSQQGRSHQMLNAPHHAALSQDINPLLSPHQHVSDDLHQHEKSLVWSTQIMKTIAAFRGRFHSLGSLVDSCAPPLLSWDLAGGLDRWTITLVDMTMMRI